MQNQGKFWTNQDGWSLADSQVSGLGNIAGGETRNTGADMEESECDASSFRYDGKYPRWRHPQAGGRNPGLRGEVKVQTRAQETRRRV